MQIKKFKEKTIKNIKTWLVENRVYKKKVNYLQPKMMKGIMIQNSSNHVTFHL